MGGKHRDRTIGFGGEREIREYLRIHQIGRELEIIDLALQLGLDGLPFGIEIGIRQ